MKLGNVNWVTVAVLGCAAAGTSVAFALGKLDVASFKAVMGFLVGVGVPAGVLRSESGEAPSV